MKRSSRWLLAVCLASASVGTLTWAQTNRRDDARAPEHVHGGKAMKALADCLAQCVSCAGHCKKLVESGKKEHLASMVLCDDCAAVCFVTMRLHANHSTVLASQAEACARICDVCAEACEKHTSDEMMRNCAQACRECAKTCREMVGKRTAEPVTR